MKFTAVFMLAILANLQYGFAQECKKETDPFSNQIVKSFEWKPGGIRTLFYESRDSRATLEFRIGEMAPVEYTVPKGSEVLIKLENGDVIKMVTILDAKSVVSKTTINADNSITFSTYFLKVNVTEEQLKKLSQSKVTYMQFPDLHGGLQTYDSKELRNKFERFLLDGAKCISDGN